MSLKSLMALFAAAAATTACASSAPFVLNNAASGVSLGSVNDPADIRNRVVFATESIVEGVAEIEIHRADDGLIPPAKNSVNAYAVNKNPLVSSYPFKDVVCAGGKKTPVLVYPRTQMQIVSDEAVRIFFVCLNDEADEFGSLYTATSTNAALSWTAPERIAYYEADGVLLKGMTPVIASLKNQNRWLLPAQTSSCSLTFIVLDFNPTTGAPTVNEDASLTFCADTNELQVSSAAWVRAPASEAKGGDNHRIVLMMLMGNSSSTSAPVDSTTLSCHMSLSDCSDKLSWSEYTPNSFGDKGSVANIGTPLPTGTTPSLLAAASYAFRSEDAGDAQAIAACKAQFPQLLLGSQTLITTTNGTSTADDLNNVTESYLAFELGQTISDLHEPSQRSLVGAVVNAGKAKTAFPSAEEISGVVTVALPPSLSVVDGETKCAPNWAFFVSIDNSGGKKGTSDLPAHISGSFTNAKFDADAAKKEGEEEAPSGETKKDSDGQPGLAAAITFCIIGGVCILLSAVFIVGFLRNRKKYSEITSEEAEVSKA